MLAVRDEVLRSDLTLQPENIRMSGRELRSALDAVRHDGVAIVSRPRPEPMTSVAAPILDQHHAPVAALSVVTRAEKGEAAALTPAVVAVARAISRAVRDNLARPGPGPGLPG